MGEQKCYNTITTRSRVARWRVWVDFPTHIMNQLLNSISMYLQKNIAKKPDFVHLCIKKENK